MTTALPTNDPLPLPSRRAVVIGAALLATAGVAAVMTPRQHQQLLVGSKLGDVIPQKLGPWTAVDGGPVVLPEQTGATEIYDQVLTRTFTSAGQPAVMLLIAYGGAQSGLMKVHRPNVCYETNGFKIGNLSRTDVRLNDGQDIPAERFVATRSDRVEQVLFWTRIGAGFPVNLDQQRWITLQEGLRGVIPDGVLVRMSTLSQDAETGRKTLLDFAGVLVQASGEQARTLLVGNSKPSLGQKA